MSVFDLPGKASRKLVDTARLVERKPRDSTDVLEAKSDKLDIKRRKPGILFISL